MKMMKGFYFLLLLFVSSVTLSAQTLKGTVLDKEGKPIPYTAIYIREAASGLAVDENGLYQTALKEGTYTLDIHSLGYERKTLQVVIASSGITTLPIQLEEKTYALKEVIVSKDKEDPAYRVMRNAIAKAPFYLHQVHKYEAEAYMKGSIKVEKIPKLLKAQMNDKEMVDMIGRLYVIESQSELSFTAPKTYEQRVIAYKNSIPQDLGVSDAAEILTTNIYDPNAMDRISPLAPGAFTYYNFYLEGATMVGEYMVNKIKVQPKKKNGKLVTGWLHIIENSWNVQYADLSSTEYGVTIRFRANYNEVMPTTFMPTTYDMDLNVNIMGIKAKGKYYASLQYKQVEVNKNLTITRDKVDSSVKITSANITPKTPKQKKEAKEMEELASKEALTTREAYQLSKLMREAAEPKEKKQAEKSLEIKEESEVDVRKTVDTLAVFRDSSYWASIRKIPLSPEEVISFQRKDSMPPPSATKQQNTISIGISTSNDKSSAFSSILFGDKIDLDKKTWFHYDGLLRSVPEYNFVDGFWIGQHLVFGYTPTKQTVLRIEPSAYYTTARKAVNWYVQTSLSYAPMRGGYLHLNGGKTTADFKRNGMLRVLNSFSSLLSGNSPISFYEKTFFEVTNTIDVINGLKATVGFRYEDRKGLHNATSYRFWGDTPMPNLYTDPQQAAILSLQADYTPACYYRVRDGKKEYQHSRFPTFSMRYERGFDMGRGKPSSQFDVIQAAIRQQFELNVFNRMSYSANAGYFLNADQVSFQDYKHFNISPIFVTDQPFESTFVLPDYYQYSTSGKWAQAHLTWESDYLLLKQLPFLQSYLFNESLHLRSLYSRTEYNNIYTEAGYSIGLGDFGRAGVFVGFDRTEYSGVGFIISLPLFKSLERP